MVLLTACGPTAVNIASQPTVPPTVAPTPTDTPVPTDTPTSIPAFPAIGEWLNNTTYANIAFVLDLQQTNSTTNVASLTTISYACEVYDSNDTTNFYKPVVNTDTETASDQINGSDISLSADVHYIESQYGYPKTVYGMQFSGMINADGSLSLASSQGGYTITCFNKQLMQPLSNRQSIAKNHARTRANERKKHEKDILVHTTQGRNRICPADPFLCHCGKC